LLVIIHSSVILGTEMWDEWFSLLNMNILLVCFYPLRFW